MSTATTPRPEGPQYDAILERLDRVERTLERLMGLLEPRDSASRAWKHLAPRPHPWRRQLYVQGRNMTVRQLVGAAKANRWSAEDAARTLDLPLEAIQEAFEYAEQERELLEYETMYEQHLLKRKGYRLGPEAVSG